MILLALACVLPRPRVDYASAPAALPLVHPSTDGRRWYVPAEVEGLGPALWFVDTGYTNTTCDDGLVAALGLEPRGHARTHAETGVIPVGRVELPPFTLGGHRVEGLVCLVRDLGTTSSVRDPPEVPVVGVLGLDLLSAFRVELDPAAATLALSDPATAGELAGGARLRISRGRSPRAKLEVEALGERRWALLDTGTATTCVDGARHGWPPTRVIAGRAAYDLDLAVGGVPVPALTAVQRDAGLGRADLLGLDALGALRLTLDPARRRAWLAPVHPAPVPAWSPELAASPDGQVATLRRWPRDRTPQEDAW